MTSKLPSPISFLIRPWNNRLRDVSICPVLLFGKVRVKSLELWHPLHLPVVNAASLPSATKSWVCIKAADICAALQVFHREPPMVAWILSILPCVAKKDQRAVAIANTSG